MCTSANTVYVSWPIYFPTRFNFYSSSIQTGTWFIQNYASYCSSLLLNLRCSSVSFPFLPRRFGPVWAFVWRWSPLAKDATSRQRTPPPDKGRHLQTKTRTGPKRRGREEKEIDEHLRLRRSEEQNRTIASIILYKFTCPCLNQTWIKLEPGGKI